MPRGIFNWNFNDVEKFLKKNHFRHSHTEGSHYYFQGSYKGILRQVCVPFHGSKTFKPRTLKGMIEQSGISQKEWLSS